MITLIAVLLALAFLLFSDWVIRLHDGKIRGEFDGWIGKFILKTFRLDFLYHKGIGLPVTLTSAERYDSKGTVIYMRQPSEDEKALCKFYMHSTLPVEGFKWTVDVNRNYLSNDLGGSRFDYSQDEIINIPFWLVPYYYIRATLWYIKEELKYHLPKLKSFLPLSILIFALYPISGHASSYNAELRKLHRELSHFQYDFHAMKGHYYRLNHAKKHFYGKGKPLQGTPNDKPYGHRNSAAIVDMVAEPSHWQTCTTGDTVADKYHAKLGAWNEQWKLFMVFALPSGNLISSYVEKRGKGRLRCDWDKPDRHDFNHIRGVYRGDIPRKAHISIRKIAEPIAAGATVAGIYVFAEQLLGFLGYIALGAP